MINRVAFTIFGHDIMWYGIIIALGLLLGILLAMYHAKREGHDPDSMLDLALIVVPMAVICARIYYVIFQWKAIYAALPFWHVFAIWEGGLAIYGAVIGGLIGVWIYTRFVNRKVRFINLLDVLAPSVVLGQAIGRWGNFVNQEAYGRAVTNPAWQWFPASVYITNPQIQGEQPGWYMATFFYESMWCFLVFICLFFYFKNSKKRKPGNVFWLYLLLYGLERVVVEGFREDSLMLGQVRVSQILSGLLMIVALCGLFWDKLSPVVMPALRAVGAWFAGIGRSISNSVSQARDRDDNVPLDESMKLRVEVPEEDEAPEEKETPEKAETPEQGVSAADQPSEPTEEAKTPSDDNQEGKD